MDLASLANSIPTSVIGLVAFVVLASLISHAWLIKYFMTYIQKKNANLERTSENFTQHLKEMDERRELERKEMESRLRECLISK